MSQPVTTNPFLIMAINMSIVFFVLWILGYIIRFIHYIDPTKQAEVKVTERTIKIPIVTNQADNVNEEEIVAAITAAIVESGYADDEFKIRSIEKING